MPLMSTSRVVLRRWTDTGFAASLARGVVRKAKEAAASNPRKPPIISSSPFSSTTSASSSPPKSSWWTDAGLWGTFTAVSGWTMSFAAIYDSIIQGPEVISLPMTGVLAVYSSLFFRWACVVKPRNLLLASCHFTNVCAQLNQLRRGLQHKIENGQEEEVKAMAEKAAMAGGFGAAAILGGPYLQRSIGRANLGVVSDVAMSDAGPFRVHFWAPMSKWLISGASLLELDRPTEKISLPQYAALTSCGIIHARYALLVIPTNYMLCSVNLALFASSSWHLGRKVKADFIDDKKKSVTTAHDGAEVVESTGHGTATVPPGLGMIHRRSTSWHADGVVKADAEP